MKNTEFYDLLDKEIMEIVDKFKNHEDIKKMDENNRKSYGFLLWFLKNSMEINGQKLEEYKEYITDGNDDNSCDLIFSAMDDSEKVYYIIQAKWFTKTNVGKTNEMEQIYKACLTDFSMILHHQKQESTTNMNFNKKYRELKRHVENNGKVKFILLMLCKQSESVRIEELSEYIKSPLVETEIYDFSMLKNFYIDLKYRGFKTDNPLANTDPVNGKIEISIIPEKNMNIGLKQKAYIFLLKPDVIYDLYDKYGNRLFEKNVRNPLEVEANKMIIETAINDPDNFWLYNNGLTAITRKVYDFYDIASKISVLGLQIINGAQTFKSIAIAYKNATSAQKRKMKEKMRVTIRIIAGVTTEIEASIIQYTNTQTAILPRDYHSGDPIQKKLYYEFLKNTEIIYERRRGEFGKYKLNQVSNEILAQGYLAYYLQDPYFARTTKDSIFKEKYEDIFNENTNYQDMYIAYKLLRFIESKITNLKKQKKTQIGLEKRYNAIKDGKYYILALFKILFIDFNEQCAKTLKDNPTWDVERLQRDYLFKKLIKNNYDEIAVVFECIVEKIEKFMEDNKRNAGIYTRSKGYEELKTFCGMYKKE